MKIDRVTGKPLTHSHLSTHNFGRFPTFVPSSSSLNAICKIRISEWLLIGFQCVIEFYGWSHHLRQHRRRQRGYFKKLFCQNWISTTTITTKDVNFVRLDLKFITECNVSHFDVLLRNGMEWNQFYFIIIHSVYNCLCLRYTFPIHMLECC